MSSPSMCVYVSTWTWGCVFVSVPASMLYWVQARAHARMRDELYANEEFMQAVHHKHEQHLGLQY